MYDINQTVVFSRPFTLFLFITSEFHPDPVPMKEVKTGKTQPCREFFTFSVDACLQRRMYGF